MWVCNTLGALAAVGEESSGTAILCDSCPEINSDVLALMTTIFKLCSAIAFDGVSDEVASVSSYKYCTEKASAANDYPESCGSTMAKDT